MEQILDNTSSKWQSFASAIDNEEEESEDGTKVTCRAIYRSLNGGEKARRRESKPSQ
jgi:hypothetical protein